MLSTKTKNAALIVSHDMKGVNQDIRMGAAFALARYLRSEGESFNAAEFYSACNCNLIEKAKR